MKNFIIITLISVSTSLSNYAKAEDVPSIGGDVISCPSKGVTTLAYYNATLPTLGPKHPPTVDISKLDETQMIEFFRGRLKDTTLLDQLDKALIAVGQVNQWIIADFKDKNTSDDPYDIPTDCFRVKGSARYSNATFIDPAYTSGLPRAELGILRMQEALFYIGIKFIPVNYRWEWRFPRDVAIAVRELIRKLMILDTPQIEIEKAITLFTRYPYPYQQIFADYFGSPYGSGTTYKNSNGGGCYATDKSDCNIVTSGNPVGQNLFLRYDDHKISDEMQFHCSIDGVTCTFVSGETNYLFKPGCQFTFNPDKKSLMFTCPNTTKTWLYSGGN